MDIQETFEVIRQHTSGGVLHPEIREAVMLLNRDQFERAYDEGYEDGLYDGKQGTND